jgi:hypothetical protein
LLEVTITVSGDIQMDTQIEPEKKRLTPDDPVDEETRGRFTALNESRLRVGDRLLDIELERVKLIRSASAIDNERQKLFERVLIERGLSPSQPVSIDSATGQLKVLTQAELDSIRSGQTAPTPPEG